MTRHFCDRCGNEAQVQIVTLSGYSKTLAQQELCASCEEAVVKAMTAPIGRAKP